MIIKNYLPAIIIIIAFGLIYLLWRVMNPPIAKVVDVSPTPNQVDVEWEFKGHVTFDRPATRDRLQIKLSPEVPVIVTEGADQKTFTIKPAKALKPDTTYQLIIGGRRITPLTIAFQTKVETIEAGVGDPGIAESDRQYSLDHPLVEYMPVLTKDFKITEKFGGKNYRVTLYGADKEKARAAALKWFSDHGVDPETLTIEWIE